MTGDGWDAGNMRRLVISFIVTVDQEKRRCEPEWSYIIGHSGRLSFPMNPGLVCEAGRFSTALMPREALK
jgi:hypothetical protein